MRRGGRLPWELDAALRELAAAVPVAVVTSKDCRFAAERVPYAAAYACITGIEVRAGGYVAVAEDLRAEALGRVLERAVGLDAFVEAKRTGDGRLAGVTVDWRESGVRPAGLDDVLAEAERAGLMVLRYSGHPFADIYASWRNKGDAVRLLKALLGVSHVAYMGDSENDLPAWREADVRIVVRHRLNKGLEVAGAVAGPYDDLPAHLRQLLCNFGRC